MTLPIKCIEKTVSPKMASIHKQPITAKLASQSCVSSHPNQEVKQDSNK